MLSALARFLEASENYCSDEFDGAVMQADGRVLRVQDL